MFKKLLLERIYALYQYKYWIILLSLLVIGYAYQKVDKSSEYISGVEFVNYGDASMFSLEVGNEVVINGKTRILNEMLVQAFYRRAQNKYNTNLITIATSQSCIYHLLLEEVLIDGQSKIVGNHLLDLLEMKKRSRLLSTDVSKLSLKEQRTLKFLFGEIRQTTTLKALEEYGNFMLTTKSKNRALVNFLPIFYYKCIIKYIESDEHNLLLQDYEFLKNKKNSKEELFVAKENQYWDLKDQYGSLTSQRDLVSFQIMENELELIEEELTTANAYFNAAEQKVKNKASQFYLVNQLYVPHENKANWFNKFLLLSIVGLLLFYVIIIVISIALSSTIKELLMDQKIA